MGNDATRYTPGPWAYLPPEAVGGAAIVPAVGPAICSFWNEAKAVGGAAIELRSDAEHEANARLIVAAPDLLAACEAAVSGVGVWPDMARSAIARARGGVPDGK